MLDKFTFKLFKNLLNGKGRAIWKDSAEHFISTAVKSRWNNLFFPFVWGWFLCHHHSTQL